VQALRLATIALTVTGAVEFALAAATTKKYDFGAAQRRSAYVAAQRSAESKCKAEAQLAE
jgi:hypothetical protein